MARPPWPRHALPTTHPTRSADTLTAYEEALFPRSESEYADTDQILDLCLGDHAPFGLIDFFTGASFGDLGPEATAGGGRRSKITDGDLS